MNISPLTIYLWQFVDYARESMQVGWGILMTTTVVFGILSLCARSSDADASEETKKSLLSWTKRMGVFTTIVGIIFTLTPTSKTIAMMVIIPKIVDSKVVQQDLPEIYDLALKALKEQLTPKK